MKRYGQTAPCPVCGGHDRAPRGQAVRCAGFLSDDGRWARCTREERAGDLTLDERTSPPTYPHRLAAPCQCGVDHRAGAPATANGSAPRPSVPARKAEDGQRDRRIVATYKYRAADGGVLYDVIRRADKTFMPRHPDPVTGHMEPGLDGVARRVPYRLPELLLSPHRRIFWPEGEKAADRLAAAGLLATTTCSGADGYRGRAAEYAEYFRGRTVAVLSDNDDPGRAYAAAVAESLFGIAASVRVVELPGLPPKGDVEHWLDSGRTVEELRELVTSTPAWAPVAEAEPGATSENASSAEPSLSAAPPPGVLLSEVMPERIDWLWHGRLARGKVTLIDGDPGNGKSALTLDAAARITTGTSWPDGATCLIGGVVLLTAEDGLADTVRPRLDAAGADSRRVVALPLVGTGDAARLPSIPADLSEVERAIERVGAVLLIVDPLMAYLGSDVASHKDQDVRRALAPLASMAERLGVAVLVVRHLNKTSGGPVMYRGGGSIGIIGAARISLLVGRDQQDNERFVLAPVKTNIGPKPPSLAYRLEPSDNGVVRLAWDPSPCSVTAAELVDAPADGEARSALDEAVAFLRDELADGPRPAKEMESAWRAAGIADGTVRRARGRLDIKPRRDGFGGPWVWGLPHHRCSSTSIDAHSETRASMGSDEHLWESAPERSGRRHVSETAPRTAPVASAPGTFSAALPNLQGDEEREATAVRSIFRSNPRPNPAMWPEPLRSALAAELARRQEMAS